MKEWNPTKLRCAKCKAMIFSEYPGHFAACRCKENFIAIDQTRHYTRYIGDLGQMEHQEGDKWVPMSEAFLEEDE